MVLGIQGGGVSGTEPQQIPEHVPTKLSYLLGLSATCLSVYPQMPTCTPINLHAFWLSIKPRELWHVPSIIPTCHRAEE